jgi:hypothetical protein
MGRELKSQLKLPVILSPDSGGRTLAGQWTTAGYCTSAINAGQAKTGRNLKRA